MGEEENKYWSNLEIRDYCGVSNSYVGQRMTKVGYEQPSELLRKSRKGKIYPRNISTVQQNRKSTQKESGFDWTAIDDKQFEELVYEIVKSYNPTYIDWRNGSGGKGRDIEAKFKLKGGLDEEKEELYFIEAKHSIKEGIKWTKISDAFTWAERYNPSVLVIATSKHLTNPCKEEVSDWKNNHSHIHVISWERKDIEELIRSKPSVRSIAIQFRIISKFMQ